MISLPKSLQHPPHGTAFSPTCSLDALSWSLSAFMQMNYPSELLKANRPPHVSKGNLTRATSTYTSQQMDLLRRQTPSKLTGPPRQAPKQTTAAGLQPQPLSPHAPSPRDAASVACSRHFCTCHFQRLTKLNEWPTTKSTSVTKSAEAALGGNQILKFYHLKM